MFKRKIAKGPKQYGPKKEKGMSTSYQRLPKLAGKLQREFHIGSSQVP